MDNRVVVAVKVEAKKNEKNNAARHANERIDRLDAERYQRLVAASTSSSRGQPAQVQSP